MAEAAIRAREKALLPAYQQMALRFADMHDTPARMFAKGVLAGVVPWREARRFFALRLKRRLTEEGLIRHVASTDVSISRHEAISMVSAWSSMVGAGLHDELAWGSHEAAASMVPPPSGARSAGSVSSVAGAAAVAAAAAARGDVEALCEALYESDKALLAWAESPGGKAQIAVELKALRSSAAARLVRDMLATSEGKEGLVKALAGVLASDTTLTAQLRALVGSK
jgi:acetyl-CoA carboxylase / biotin carboxylase 1